jgi:phage/plasmid-associated DNA primase
MRKTTKLIFEVRNQENIVKKIKELIILLEDNGFDAIDFYTKYDYSEKNNNKKNFITEFLSEYNITTGSKKITLAELYEMYNDFCDSNAFNKEISKSVFKSLISDNGITCKRVTNGYVFLINKDLTNIL